MFIEIQQDHKNSIAIPKKCWYGEKNLCIDVQIDHNQTDDASSVHMLQHIIQF